MTTIDTHTETRRRRARRPADPTPAEMLDQFSRDNPTATPAELRELVHNFVVANAEFEDAKTRALTMWLVDDALGRKLRDTVHRSPTSPTSPTAAIVAGIRRKFGEVIEAEVKIRLLETVTPNGTVLGDCTGAQCRDLGGFYAEIAKRLNPRDHVRVHLSEIELQEIAKPWRSVLR